MSLRYVAASYVQDSLPALPAMAKQILWALCHEHSKPTFAVTRSCVGDFPDVQVIEDSTTSMCSCKGCAGCCASCFAYMPATQAHTWCAGAVVSVLEVIIQYLILMNLIDFKRRCAGPQQLVPLLKLPNSKFSAIYSDRCDQSRLADDFDGHQNILAHTVRTVPKPMLCSLCTDDPCCCDLTTSM